jgi:hypothetical protein
MPRYTKVEPETRALQRDVRVRVDHRNAEIGDAGELRLHDLVATSSV